MRKIEVRSVYEITGPVADEGRGFKSSTNGASRDFDQVNEASFSHGPPSVRNTHRQKIYECILINWFYGVLFPRKRVNGLYPSAIVKKQNSLSWHTPIRGLSKGYNILYNKLQDIYLTILSGVNGTTRSWLETLALAENGIL